MYVSCIFVKQTCIILTWYYESINYFKITLYECLIYLLNTMQLNNGSKYYYILKFVLVELILCEQLITTIYNKLCSLDFQAIFIFNRMLNSHISLCLQSHSSFHLCIPCFYCDFHVIWDCWIWIKSQD